jgi:hypothetical protein
MPLRSVSLARTRSVNERSEWGTENYLLWGLYATKLDDSRFDNYHIFRATIRMILPRGQAVALPGQRTNTP